MPVPEKIAQLVERFDTNIADYKRSTYNETQTRREFIDPFFQALGWDVDNSQGKPETQKDVIHEAKVLVDDAQKAPDYCFRIGKDPKFFVEAKKPSVSLKDSIHPAYQLRRYGWSATLPVSILTDFEEFAVYDCRVMPAKDDKATHARLLYVTYADYLTKWDDLAALFSRGAIVGGSLEKYADAQKEARGVLPVDVAFLQDIERWRDQLARHLATSHPALTRRDLNYAVQRTIDRIIFLRICEDRGIEPRGKLQNLLNHTNIYGELVKRFYEADAKYNSGIFHFKAERDHKEDPDTLTPTLSIGDDLLKGILKRLYFPDSPYAFDVFPAEMLGQVYEQFLGKVICLDAQHQATVEEKPEVKKAGGVYYTPAYIVEYIVAQTVGELFKDKTPKQAEALTILDPACGSGSFLIGAYQYLLDWHLDRYLADDPAKWSKTRPPRLRQLEHGWVLTIAERKRILLSHIYGVDIDDQAVEVTKLSLLLKVLEGEDDQSLSGQMTLFHERVLPNLAKNIKWGNSLISHDFYEGKQIAFDEEELIRVNAFDWGKGFPEVTQAGGFDSIIGNPPYLFITELNKPDKEYFFKYYKTSEYRFDVYGLFIELAVSSLAKHNGYISFIIPHTLLSNDSFEKLRNLTLERTFLEHVIDIGPGVFQTAKNETMVFIARKDHKPITNKKTHVVLTTSKTFPQPSKEFWVDSSTWRMNKSAAWIVKMSESESQIIAKLEKISPKLGELCTINQGLRTGNNEKYLAETAESETWKPAVGGKHIGRYAPLSHEIYVYYEPSVLDAPRRRDIFESSEKIIVQEVRNITLPRRIIATYDMEQFYCLQSTNVINLKKEALSNYSIKFLLGILNSTLVNFFFRHRFSGNNHIASNQLAQIPIPPVDNIQQGKIEQLVTSILELHCQKKTSKTGTLQELYHRQIEAIDTQIDKLVYELYGLTDDEIQLVEAGT